MRLLVSVALRFQRIYYGVELDETPGDDRAS